MSVFRFYVVDRARFEEEPEGEDRRQWFASKREADAEYRRLQREDLEDLAFPSASLDVYEVGNSKRELLEALNRGFLRNKVMTLRKT